MRKLSLSSLMALTALVVMTGCGRSTLNQSALPLGSESMNPNYGNSTATSYPAPQTLPGTQSQPAPGAKAVATPNGYVYEQNPTSTSAAYNFYNSQNPCLFSKAGQRAACNGQASYYAQPGAGGTYPTTPTTSSYGNYPQNNGTYAQGAYAQGGYPQSSYSSGYPQTGTPAYGASTTYGQSSPYSTYNRANTAARTPAQQTVQQQSAARPQQQTQPATPPQTAAPSTGQSQADKAQSRIAPGGASSSGSSSGGSKKISF